MGYKIKRTERENILFLILIAVMLCVSLLYLYAVTLSAPSGKDVDDKVILSRHAALLTQYPAGLSTTLLRMSHKGVTDIDYMFNPPSDQSNCAADISGVSACVFSSNGGNAPYQRSAPETVTGATGGVWLFNGDNEVNNIGSSAGGNAPTLETREILAILPNITTDVCQYINIDHGIGNTIPTETNIDVSTYLDDTTNGDNPTEGGGTIGGDVRAFDGHALGCFKQNGINYYYHTLMKN